MCNSRKQTSVISNALQHFFSKEIHIPTDSIEIVSDNAKFLLKWNSPPIFGANQFQKEVEEDYDQTHPTKDRGQKILKKKEEAAVKGFDLPCRQDVGHSSSSLPNKDVLVAHHRITAWDEMYGCDHDQGLLVKMKNSTKFLNEPSLDKSLSFRTRAASLEKILSSALACTNTVEHLPRMMIGDDVVLARKAPPVAPIRKKSFGDDTVATDDSDGSVSSITTFEDTHLATK